MNHEAPVIYGTCSRKPKWRGSLRREWRLKVPPRLVTAARAEALVHTYSAAHGCSVKRHAEYCANSRTD